MDHLLSFVERDASRELASTLRSRSMSLFLGGDSNEDEELVDRLANDFSGAVESYLATGATVHLLAGATALERAGDWRDLRAAAPWTLTAAARGAKCGGRGASACVASRRRGSSKV